MISVEEAKGLVLSHKKNYRKQERIDLENRVSAEIEKAAKEGESTCIVPVNPKDSDYIQDKLKENGFKCDMLSPVDRHVLDDNFIHIKIWWWD